MNPRPAIGSKIKVIERGNHAYADRPLKGLWIVVSVIKNTTVRLPFSVEAEQDGKTERFDVCDYKYEVIE